MSSLFTQTNFVSHCGLTLNYKIECDALTNEDIETFSQIISKNIQFQICYGVPSGGIRLADELNKFATKSEEHKILIVDDVLTTGGSMKDYRFKLMNTLNKSESDFIGVVLFSRGINDFLWIKPVLTITKWFK